MDFLGTMNTAALLVFGIMVLPGPCINSDNLELLAGTLRTRQRAACDDEIVSLSCPIGTYISIQVAKYGNMPEGHGCVAGAAPLVNMDKEGDKECLRPNIMQYSLLQTVVEACQKKPQCEFSTKTKPGIIDPCPQVGKIVEVAYKCRPHEFHSRTVCEGETTELSCNPNTRLVIYDAQYGRVAHQSPSICALPPGAMDDTCSAPYALKTTMQICHGKQQCQIVADSKTFGSPCRPDTRANLRVLHTCVPLGVLTERYENASEEDKVTNRYDVNNVGEHFETPDIVVKWNKPTKTDNMIPQTAIIHSTSNLNGIKYKDSSTKSSNLKFLIYISIATIIVIILAAIFVGVRYYKKKKRSSNSKNGDMFTTEAPNVFNDAASDLDNDVDVSHISGTFYDPVHPDMILYRDGVNKATLRAMRPLNTIYPCAGASMYGNVDYVPTHSRDASTRFGSKEVDSDIMMSPKSLSGYTNSQFYYG
nr:uncharacterized protein LOC117987692 [Maniola hyperantus]